MSTGSTIERFAEIVGATIDPLASVLTDEETISAFVEQLGWILPSVPQALKDLGTAAGEVRDARGVVMERRAELDEGSGSEGALATALAALLVKVTAFAVEVDGVPAKLEQQLPPDYRTATGIVEAFQSRFYGYLLVRALEDLAPRVRGALAMLGLIELTDKEADETIHQPDFILREFHWDKVGTLLSDPAAHFKERYGWGTPELKAERLFRAMEILSYSLMSPAEFEYPSPELLAAIAPGVPAPAGGPDPMLLLPVGNAGAALMQLAVAPAPKATPTEKQGLALHLLTTLNFTDEIPLGPLTSLVIGSTVQLTSGVAVVIRPEGNLQAISNPEQTPTPFTSGKVSLRLRYAHEEGEQPVVLLSAGNGARLEASELFLEGALAARGTGVDLGLEAGMKGGRAVLSRSGADGFLAKVLPEKDITFEFDFAVGLSQQRGVYFSGSGGLETTIPLNFALGPVAIEAVKLKIRFVDGKVVLVVGAAAKGQLGPVTVSVDGVGLATELDPRPGNLGPVDLSLDFAPPTALGVAINSGPVAGGGFLAFDPPAGRYSGALALRIYEISLSAFGIIETKGPGGGFSFAIIISAKFTPVPLGFGFTLNGVGGMLGINRTVEVELLQEAVRKHTLDHVLFPEEPEKNALAILNDLGAFFPAAEGRYTFGPMAIIGWGGGTALLLEAELGVILEVPEPVRLVLLGQIKVGLPDLKNRFVKLNFDIVGALDFAKKTFSLDASMYDSQIGGFDLSGEMALRLNWGSQPDFVLSIGGFHPHYRAPAGFPKLKRVTVALANNGNPSITIKGYLAVTSNTFQIGAKAEVLAYKGSFNVYGWVGFDALIVFQPFGFRADFGAGVALRKGTRNWASIHLSGTLSGPNPWHASGEACLSLFLFDICVGFDVELSKRKRPVIEELPPIIEKLIPELEAARSWSVEPGPAAHQCVTLVEGAGTGEDPLLDPLGIAVVKQRIVPLEFKLDLYQHVTLGKTDPKKFRIKSIHLGNSETGFTLPGTPPVVKDWFARGQYQKLSDAQKLALPGFELMNAGTKVGLDGVDAGDLKPGTTDYETFIIDGPDVERGGAANYELASELTEKLARRSGMALGGLQAHGPEKFAAAPVLTTATGDEPYTIATMAGLQARNDLIQGAEDRFGAVSRGAARDILEAHLRDNPADRGKLQVVPRLELPNAA